MLWFCPGLCLSHISLRNNIHFMNVVSVKWLIILSFELINTLYTISIGLATDQRIAYVPRSCCVRDRFWRYIDVDTCQKWMVGPPGSLDTGSATNHVLYYQVCIMVCVIDILLTYFHALLITPMFSLVEYTL